MIFKLVQILIFVVFLSTHVFGANRVTSSRATLDTPLTEAEIEEIKTSRNWPERFIIQIRTQDPAIIDSLGSLPELKRLAISSDQDSIAIDEVIKFPNLTVLSVTKTGSLGDGVVDATPVGHLTGLEEFVGIGYNFSNLSALVNCPALTKLSLKNGRLESLEFLEEIPQLIELNISSFRNEISSYDPIGTLSQLETLSISMNDNATAEMLESFTQLSELWMIDLDNCDGLESLNFLRQCYELERLEAERCKKLTNIDGLKNLRLLSEVNIAECPLEDIEGLANKPYLRSLMLGGTPVVDLSPLSQSYHLERLMLNQSKVSDLSHLANMQRLNYIDLNESNADISTLPKLRYLEDIRLQKLEIADLTPLLRMPKLDEVDLAGATVNDYTPLYKIKTLERVTLSRSVPDDLVQEFESVRPDISIKKR